MAGRKTASYSIIDYVKDNGQSFDQSGFNEIDGLVLSQVSNIKLQNSGIDVSSGGNKTIAQIYNEMQQKGTPAHDAFVSMKDENLKSLLKELSISPRYKDLQVSNFIENPSKTGVTGYNSIGEEQVMEQFAAVTITYQQNGETYNYMSFRATDSSTNGWTEDFAMLYCETQAYADSVVYMNSVAPKLDGIIVGGGHSKGGGEFEYGYLFCDESVKNRIQKGYVYDSPGMNNEIMAKTNRFDDYQLITEGSKIYPKDSIIGQVLHENENGIFVDSEETYFNEHDPFSWKLSVNNETNEYSFVEHPQTAFSKKLNELLDEVVASLTPEEKKAFFLMLSYLMYNNSTGKEGIDGLIHIFTDALGGENGTINYSKLLEAIGLFREAWDEMTSEEQDAFCSMLGKILALLKEEVEDWIKEEVKSKFNDWVEDQVDQIKEKYDFLKQKVIDFTDWVESKKAKVLSMIDSMKKTVIYHFKIAVYEFKGLFRDKTAKYVSAHTIIRLSPVDIDFYAGKLDQINNRISSLDSTLDGLYGRLNIIEEFKLMGIDIRIHYEHKLQKCALYLRETLRDFEKAEAKINRAASELRSEVDTLKRGM